MPLHIPRCHILKLNFRALGFIFRRHKENAICIFADVPLEAMATYSSSYLHAASVPSHNIRHHVARRERSLLFVPIMTTDQWKSLVCKILWSKGLPIQ